MTDKSVTLPSLPHGMLHAIETSEHFSTFCLYFALELLQKAKQRVERIFPRRGNALKKSQESRSRIAVKLINANNNATQKMKSQLKQEF